MPFPFVTIVLFLCCSKTRTLYLDGAEDSVISIPSDSLPFQNIPHGVFGCKSPSSEHLASVPGSTGMFVFCEIFQRSEAFLQKCDKHLPFLTLF